MNKTLQRTLPIVLSVLSSAGVVATTILAIKATPKAQKRLNEIKDKSQKDGVTANKVEIFKAVAPLYLPTVIVGTATVASIISGTIISKKIEASLSATCLALDQGYKKYKGKVNQLFGLDANEDILKSIAKDEYEEQKPAQPVDNRKLYWNEYTGFFYAEPVNVITAIHNMCMRLAAYNSEYIIPLNELGTCTIKQFIEESNAELLNPNDRYNEFKDFGWNYDYLEEMMGDNWLYYGVNDDVTENGEKYTVIIFSSLDPIYDPGNYIYGDWDRMMQESDKLDSDVDVMMEKEN